MRCEVCGRQIRGKPHRVVIERAKMTTCSRCAELGSALLSSEPRRPKPSAKGERPVRPKSAQIRKRRPLGVPEDLVVVGDYALLVRQAREKSNLAQADLGRKIGEKVSVISKVESGKMMPSQRLAAKLEHALRISLLVPLVVPKTSSLPSPTTRSLTLGEIAMLKEGKRRRRQNNESGHSQP